MIEGLHIWWKALNLHCRTQEVTTGDTACDAVQLFWLAVLVILPYTVYFIYFYKDYFCLYSASFANVFIYFM